jgi:hypothetical protein
MARIKEFYFDEICRMQNGEKFSKKVLTDKLKAFQKIEANQIKQKIFQFESIQTEVNNSEIPKFIQNLY